MSIQNMRTPRWLFDELNERFGPFVLDAFADGSNALCAKYYTAVFSAFDFPWGNVTFANPPFRLMSECLEKAHSEWIARQVRSVVIGPVGCSQKWFHRYARSAHIFVPTRRINFDLPDGTPTEGANRDTMIYAFGARHQARGHSFAVRSIEFNFTPKKQETVCSTLR